MTKRIDYFDFIRGVAILMVIAIHTMIPSNNDYVILTRQIFNCAVPLFLAISGYFLSKKDVSNSESYYKFLKKQITKVYIPCIIWSLPFFLFDVYRNSDFGLDSVWLFACGYSIYYFIAVIIQFYILLPLLQRFSDFKGVILSLIISMISISLVTYLLHVNNMSLQLIAYAGPCFLWIVFFMIGLYLGKTNNRKFPITLLSILLICTLFISFGESKYWYYIDGGGLGIKLSSFIFSIVAIFLLFSENFEKLFSKIKGVYSGITLVGKLSFGIYLSHCYTILLINKVLPPPSAQDYDVKIVNTSILSDLANNYLGRFHFDDLNSVLLILSGSWLFKWFMVSVISFSIVWIGHKYLPKKLRTIIGF